MNLEQYNNWQKFREAKGEIKVKEVKMIARYYADLFNEKYTVPCTCNKRIWKERIEALNKHFLSIEKPTE